MLVKFFLTNILRTNCGQILLDLSRQTSLNRSVWGCMNLYRGGQIYQWNTDNFYQGASWSGTIYDDNGDALSMCGQNP